MKVVVSVGGRFHAVHLAVQLEALGYLERIITTKGWYVDKVLPRRRYHAIPVVEYLGEVVRRIPSLRRKGMYSYIKDNLFDALARKYVPPCDIFHAWGNYALYCIPTARSFGASVVIERGSTHPHFQDAILREEFERFGVGVERAHPQIIEKGMKEIELADAVIIPSSFVRRSFVSQGVPEEKLHLIPYGIDLSSFQPVPKADDVFRVLFVGNIGIQKGVHYLLEAWKSLALPHAELVFVGAIDKDFERMFKRYEGLYRYAGHVPHEQLSAWYSQASVFVLPSLQEGSALVTYEAMACGIPSVVSENTGSIIRDGIDGWVVPIRSSDAIAEKILHLFEHAEQSASYGASAAAYVAGYTWERYAREVVRVYRSLRAIGGEHPLQ
jgi:glycosyltransferase involved in cell wall biosynthesis